MRGNDISERKVTLEVALEADSEGDITCFRSVDVLDAGEHTTDPKHICLQVRMILRSYERAKE